MQSKILFRYHPNGNLEQVVTNTDKIYQGQVGTVDYRIEMVDPADSDSWRATDVVLIVLTRPDNRTAQRVMIRRNGGWEVTSNGWETDVDITDSAYLNVSFIARRFSTLSPNRVVAEKTTAAVTLEIQPSAGYSPLNIAEGDAEDILEAISIMQGDIETLEAEKESKAHAEETYRTKADSLSRSESQILLSGKISTAQKGAPNGVAELDANSKIKMAQVPLDTDANLAANSDSKIPSQKAVRGYVDNRFRLKSDSFTKLETMALVGNNGIIVDTYTQMLALPTPANMLRCYVRDATGDTSVASGGAYYLYDAAQTRWVKTSEEESLDIIQDASHLKVIPRTGFLEDFNSSNQEELNTKLMWGILGAAQNAAIKSGEAQFNFIQYEYDMAVATFEALSNIPPDELYDKLVCVVRSSGVWYEWSADSQSWSIILPISTEMSGMVYYNYTGDVDPGTQTVTIYGDFTMILPLPALIYMMFVGGIDSIPGSDAQKLEIFNLIKDHPMSYLSIDMGDSESTRMAFNASDINFLYAQEEDAEMIAFFGNCMTPGDGVWLLRKIIIKHDENDPQYVWIDTSYTEVIENKQDKTDQNLQTQSKDIVGAINEVKGLAEAAGSDIASNWGNLYVNTQGSDENGFGTLKKPYKTITKALSMAISDGTVNVAPGAYNEDILFDSNVANGITLLAYGATLDQSKWMSVEGGYNGLKVRGITLNGGLFAEDSSTALGSEFEDVTVLGDTNISQAGGDVSFKNCKIIGNQNGGVLIGSAFPNTTRKIRFNNCEFIGHDPWGLNRSIYVGPNGPDVVITNSRGIRAILGGGRVYFYGNNQFSMGESLVSTVNVGDGYLHVGSGASFKNEDGIYGHINKTGTCDYVLGAVDRDAANDVLNGMRLYDCSVNDIGGFAELYAKAITGESEYGGTVVDNLNNIAKNGFYTCYGTATGVPSASSSWWVLHQNSNVGTAAASQIAIAYSDMPGQSMVRYRIKTSGTWWSTWEMIPDTAFVDFMIAQAFNNPTFTGNVTVPTASGANHAVNKGQMDTAIEGAGYEQLLISEGSVESATAIDFSTLLDSHKQSVFKIVLTATTDINAYFKLSDGTGTVKMRSLTAFSWSDGSTSFAFAPKNSASTRQSSKGEIELFLNEVSYADPNEKYRTLFAKQIRALNLGGDAMALREVYQYITTTITTTMPALSVKLNVSGACGYKVYRNV